MKNNGNADIVATMRKLLSTLPERALEEQVEILNELRKAIHEVSPFKEEPVDCVLWVSSDLVHANDYNPNSVAPPEMKLLEHSIQEDGYTQPIVSWINEGKYEVVDGFHRHRVGKESLIVGSRLQGYLPLTIINDARLDRGDRIAATIRHNRARGKHQVQAMSDIVVELKRRNWSNDRIGRELGMDQDEVLRLCQITGLAELFSDQEFSKSWDVEGSVSEEDFKELSDDKNTFGEEVAGFRTVNTSDGDRVFHKYTEWECYKAGFYATTLPGMTKEQCEMAYRKFLSDTGAFSDALERVTKEWKNSCEHYLTNKAMNRIAWLGQAGACYALGIPSTYRGGFNLLTPEQQAKANQTALTFLNKWLVQNNRSTVTLEEAISGQRQSDIY